MTELRERCIQAAAEAICQDNPTLCLSHNAEAERMFDAVLGVLRESADEWAKQSRVFPESTPLRLLAVLEGDQ